MTLKSAGMDDPDSQALTPAQAEALLPSMSADVDIGQLGPAGRWMIENYHRGSNYGLDLHDAVELVSAGIRMLRRRQPQ